MTYQESLIKRIQELLNNYFDSVKTFDTDDLEAELFMVKGYLVARQNLTMVQDDKPTNPPSFQL